MLSQKNKLLLLLVLLAGGLLTPGFLPAHPLLSENHNRSISIRVLDNSIQIDYVLEVDELRAARDLAPLPEEQRLKIRSREQLHEAFLNMMAETLAINLIANIDNKSLNFICTQKSLKIKDHLQCFFRFEAPFNSNPSNIISTESPSFQFRESNFEEDDFSSLTLVVFPTDVAVLTHLQLPPPEIVAKLPIDRAPGDSEKLRVVRFNFTLEGKTNVNVGQEKSPESSASESKDADHSMLHLLLDNKKQPWIVFMLALFFGAAHALTPGHGKTLAAAYLIGEKGTLFHAFLLGLVTTVSHTGGVLLLAIFLPILFPNAAPKDVQIVLGFFGGITIALLGAWLFFRRILGQADHHHGPGASHSHNTDGSVSSNTPDAGWKGIVVLGIAGGIIPCWDAVAMLIFAISAGLAAWAVPLLLAFSTGMAGVLVAVGITVVKARDLIKSKTQAAIWLERISKVLPIVGAIFIIIIGVWLCAESLKIQTPH